MIANFGTNSWSGRMQVIGYEVHNVDLALEALAAGFWINNTLAVICKCESSPLPKKSQAAAIKGNFILVRYRPGSYHY